GGGWGGGRGRGGSFGGRGLFVGGRGSRGGEVGLRPRRRAALHLFHDDRLGAAVAETLAHHALLDAAPLQAQRLAGGDAQLLFASLFRRFSHSTLNSEAFRRVSSCVALQAGPRRPAGPILVDAGTDPASRRPGNSRGAQRAPEMSRFRVRQAGLHVSHLTVPMPNPIAPR